MEKEKVEGVTFFVCWTTWICSTLGPRFLILDQGICAQKNITRAQALTHINSRVQIRKAKANAEVAKRWFLAGKAVGDDCGQTYECAARDGNSECSAAGKCACVAGNVHNGVRCVPLGE